jgi:hypothetical protein
MIKSDLRCEIEAWVAAGNMITVIESEYDVPLNAELKKSKVNKKMWKRSTLDETHITAVEIYKFNAWLNTKKGRTEALSDVLDCSVSDITQIQNEITSCSKARFEDIRIAMRAVEISEKFDE